MNGGCSHSAAVTGPDAPRMLAPIINEKAGMLTQMLRPYMDLMTWDVRPSYELDRQQVMETIRQAQQQQA